MMEQIRPKIVIEGQTLEVEERQAIVLPCLVDHLGIVCLIKRSLIIQLYINFATLCAAA